MASLVYRVSSRRAMEKQRNPVKEKQTNKYKQKVPMVAHAIQSHHSTSGWEDLRQWTLANMEVHEGRVRSSLSLHSRETQSVG